MVFRVLWSVVANGMRVSRAGVRLAANLGTPDASPLTHEGK